MNPAVLFAPLLRRLMRPSITMKGSQFEQLPRRTGRVLFLGDSITEFGVWAEWFPDLEVTNRGIGGDSVGGVRARLDTAISDPLAISLLIGTNDLSGLGISRRPEQISDQTRALVAEIRARAPEAPIFLNSVLPRTKSMAPTIRDLNDRYRRIAAEAGVVYVDLWPALADDAGALKTEFTHDHIHLTGAGYESWVQILRPLLAPYAVRSGERGGAGDD